MKTPKSITDIVRSRFDATKEQRKHVLEAIYSGRPLDAEPSEIRKIHRLQSVAGVNTEEAKKIANYEQEALKGLANEKKLGAERIQGKSVDFVGVSFLDLARAGCEFCCKSCVSRFETNRFWFYGFRQTVPN